jgi:hypothetical protein
MGAEQPRDALDAARRGTAKIIIDYLDLAPTKCG